jgi:hypothetical protein
MFGKIKTEILEVSCLENMSFREGHFNFPQAPIFNAPWYKMKSPNHKTYIIDLQGTFIN